MKVRRLRSSGLFLVLLPHIPLAWLAAGNLCVCVPQVSIFRMVICVCVCVYYREEIRKITETFGKVPF